MDLLNDKVSKLYFKFLAAAFGSALISSIYGLVDMIVVGQYHGPDGAAAMAVISPIWNIIYSFGLLSGIGGSVLFSFEKGKSDNIQAQNAYFTASVTLGGIISVLLWIIVIFFDDPLLYLFGASDELMPLCKSYLIAPKITVPVFVFTQIMSAFLRNDSNPSLSTKAVLAGGIFNVFGDYFCVFTLDMGIEGAGLATAMGASISLIVMFMHFFSKKNTLKFNFKKNIFSRFAPICKNGFSSFIIDVAMGVLTMLFNRQIMRFFGSDALAVYGIIVLIGTFVQCCSYGVGQASQPIISQNYGAGKFDRIKTMLKYNAATSIILGVIWTALCILFPNGFIHLFMQPTESVLSIAPAIIRAYAISFLLLPLNIYSTYYFQATMKAGVSMIISIARGIVVSGILIMVLPQIFSPDSLWFAMPITETAIFIYVLFALKKQLSRFPQEKQLSI